MKTITNGFVLLLSFSIAEGTFRQAVGATVNVLERGQHYNVVQAVRPAANGQGESTNQFTVLGNGINYRDANTNWVASVPIVQSYPNGIICTGASYQVILSTNLNVAGAVDMQTSDKKRIVSQPVGIGFFDPESGQSVLLAQIRNCQAEVVSNRIVYADAFEGSGIEAAVTYRYDVGHFHQDITFVKRPSVTPTNFGMSSRTRLELLTEILDSPQPTKQTHVLKQETNEVRRAQMAEPDLVDETLSFGEMVMGVGRALRTDASGPSKRGIVVAKRLITVENQKLLIEAVEWRDARPELEKLPVQSAGMVPLNNRVGLGRRLPERRIGRITLPPFQVRLAEIVRARPAVRVAMAERQPSLPAGFLWDYEIVEGASDFTFQNGHTYYVESDVVISGATFESGAVIKYAVGGSLALSTSVQGPTGPSKVVFTAKDDDSVGASITNSTGHPSGRYAEVAIATYYYSYPYWQHLDIRHAETGFYQYDNSDGTSVGFSYFYKCDLGAYVPGYDTTLYLYSSDLCDVDTWYMSDWEEGVTTDSLTTCQADRDNDGLPDNWEFQHFDNLNQTPNGDYDSDSWSNFQEYLNGTNPLSYNSANGLSTTNGLVVFTPLR